MEITPKKPKMFSNIQENVPINFIDEIRAIRNAKQYQKIEEEEPETDNFTLLLIKFAIWMKQYHYRVSIELLKENTFKIRMDNIIGEESLKIFSTLFEELTLTKIVFNFNDIANEWFCKIGF